jgi:hypothetical protein
MGKYLDILRQAEAQAEVSYGVISHPSLSSPLHEAQKYLWDTFWELESRCPDYVPFKPWHQAVAAGRAFLAERGAQAATLGWTAGDVFGLATPPENPRPTYDRLGRLDVQGIVWMLHQKQVVALTESTASIRHPSGAITVFKRRV